MRVAWLLRLHGAEMDAHFERLAPDDVCKERSPSKVELKRLREEYEEAESPAADTCEQ